MRKQGAKNVAVTRSICDDGTKHEERTEGARYSSLLAKSLPCMCRDPIRVPVCVPAASFPMQLSAYSLEKQKSKSQSLGILNP